MWVNFLQVAFLFLTVATSTNNGSNIILYDENDTLSNKIGIKWNSTLKDTEYSQFERVTESDNKFHELITKIYDVPWMKTSLKENILVNLLTIHFPIITKEDIKYECNQSVVEHLNKIVPMSLLSGLENDSHYSDALPYLRIFNLTILTIRHHMPFIEKGRFPLGSILNLFYRKMKSFLCARTLLQLDEFFKRITSNTQFPSVDGNIHNNFLLYSIEYLEEANDIFEPYIDNENDLYLFKIHIDGLKSMFKVLNYLAKWKDSKPSDSAASEQHIYEVNSTCMVLCYNLMEIFLSNDNSYITFLIDCISNLSKIKSTVESFNKKEQLENSLVEIFKIIEIKVGDRFDLYAFKKYDETNIISEMKYIFSRSGGPGYPSKIYLIISSNNTWKLNTFAKTFFCSTGFLTFLGIVLLL